MNNIKAAGLRSWCHLPRFSLFRCFSDSLLPSESEQMREVHQHYVFFPLLVIKAVSYVVFPLLVINAN